MLVHLVVIPGSGTLSWTVLGTTMCGRPGGPVPAYLTDIGRSPNTVKAYAHDLKDYWDFIGGVTWTGARRGSRTSGSSSRGCSYPRRGGPGRSRCCRRRRRRSRRRPSNRKLAAVSAFYAHQARNGAGAGDLLAAWKTGAAGGWKPFLHHVSKGKPYRGRAVSLKVPQKLPRILTVAETQAILDACTRLRTASFRLLHESGMFSRGAKRA